jgi:hypothetical protein
MNSARLIIPTNQSLKLYKNNNFVDNIIIDFANIEPNIIEIDLSFIKYDFPLNNLPSQIISLILDSDYNYPLDNLPCNLKQLVLGMKYNQPLEYLPESLEKLYIGINYSHNLINLPKNLQTLILHSNFLKNINLDLPNLEILHLDFINIDINNVETFFYQLSNLKNIKELFLPAIFPQKCNTKLNFSIFENFNKLEYLVLGLYNERINKFPPNIKHLRIDFYNHNLNNLPDNLEILEIGDEYDHELNNLPNTLQCLDMGENIKCNIILEYPKSLKELKIIETHPQRQQLNIININKKINIITIPDYDYYEKSIKDMNTFY